MSRSVMLLVAGLLAGLLMPGRAAAATIEVRALANGAAVADAVVSLHPLSANAGQDPRPAVMDQHNSAFVPGVLPVQRGSRVSFPNRDQIRHQVYSFSKARPFELPLYAGSEASPITFDREGVVVIGCNIHDFMIGHIVVVDTPYFGKTDARGTSRLEPPPGEYRLQVWHQRLPGAVHEQVMRVSAGASLQVEVTLQLAAAVKPASDRLRTLQDKFRRIESRP